MKPWRKDPVRVRAAYDRLWRRRAGIVNPLADLQAVRWYLEAARPMTPRQMAGYTGYKPKPLF